MVLKAINKLDSSVICENKAFLYVETCVAYTTFNDVKEATLTETRDKIHLMVFNQKGSYVGGCSWGKDDNRCIIYDDDNSTTLSIKSL